MADERIAEESEAVETRARPSILQLALPAILGNLLYGIVGLVQTKVVGQLGAEALAAVGAGQRVFFALQAVMMAIGAGTTALVARAWGRNDEAEAGRITIASLVLGCAFGLVLTIPGVFFSSHVAAIFGLDAHTVELAAANIRWLSIFNVAFAANFIMGGALRAAGDAWTPLYVGAFVNMINVPLLYMFVFGLWGAPALGVAGAALAAGLSFTLGAIVLVGLWFKQLLLIRYIREGWFKAERIQRLLDIGYPAGVEQIIFQAGFFVFLMLIGNYYGTQAFAAYNIGVNVLNICMVAGFGFSIAGATLVGQHLGANDMDGAMQAGWRSLRMAIITMGILGLIVIYFARDLAHFFIGNDAVTIQHTVEFTYVLGAMMPLMAVDFAIGGSLRGAGDTRFPLMTTFLGLIGMRCTLAAIFTYFGLPVRWVYAALIGDYVLKGVMLLWRFRSGHWKYVVRNEELTQERA
jgi:putative MATE family efflux protein